MKLAFSKPTNGLDEQRLMFDRFRQAGYEGLQLKGGQYAAHLDDPSAFQNEWGDDQALTTALITGGTLDQSGLAQLRDTIAFAQAVKAERLVFCHGLSRIGLADEDIAGFAKTLSQVGREAADQGVALSLHHHFDQPVMHRHDFDVFFDAADHDAVHLTVDTAHLVKSGITDVAGLVRDFANVIDNLHLKDFADGQWRLLGEGTIDFPALFEALQDTGYDGWLCVDEETSTELTEAMDRSRAALSSLLQPRG
ncbi:sugar phosphate isomerase/epimerase family protein [Tenggerimyces flavus]|uniref:Sugar phosphate isomerase/epimerase family protein n=1 Tax=Tenggerimyces flavus TaxID=1708749 RepID=A0ABV7YGQ6_9ACTN|nr:TIM barrel protein [Tenggerimyces flavus]MBM7789324.1 sugar phosphate isomerase/epimerase [Tenggerimyces flavus]